MNLSDLSRDEQFMLTVLVAGITYTVTATILTIIDMVREYRTRKDTQTK